LLIFDYVAATGMSIVERKLRSDTFIRLNGKYGSVFAKIKETIEKVPDKFKIDDLVLKLNAIDADNRTIFSTDDTNNVKITIVHELFRWIAKWCNIYNYDLLRGFVISIECEEAIKLINDFTKELQELVLMELDLFSEVGKPLPGTHVLEIKYTGNDHLCSTEKLVREIICDRFDSKRWSITFLCAGQGCTALVYQISPALKSYLLQCKTTSDDGAALQKRHIEQILIDNEILKMPSKSLVSYLWYELIC